MLRQGHAVECACAAVPLSSAAEAGILVGLVCASAVCCPGHSPLVDPVRLCSVCPFSWSKKLDMFLRVLASSKHLKSSLPENPSLSRADEVSDGARGRPSDVSHRASLVRRQTGQLSLSAPLALHKGRRGRARSAPQVCLARPEASPASYTCSARPEVFSEGGI